MKRKAMRPFWVGMVYSAFLLTSYSVPGSITIRAATLLVLLVFAGFCAQTFVKLSGLSWGLVSVLYFSAMLVWASLPAAVTALDLGGLSHFEYLGFGVGGLLMGATFAAYLLHWKEIHRLNLFLVSIIIPFIIINLIFLWGSAPGTSQFNGVFRDRNYFAFYSVALVWLSHFGEWRRSTHLLMRVPLLLFVLLSGSVGGLLMLLLYALWRAKRRLHQLSSARRMIVAVVFIALLPISVTLYPIIPAAQRVGPWVEFLMSREAPETGSSAIRRLHQASEGLRVALENPLTGVGYGSAQYVIQTLPRWPEPYSLHNTYLEIWAGAGIAPLTVFLSGLFWAAFRSFNCRWCKRRGVPVMIMMTAVFLGSYSALHRFGPMFFLGAALALAFGVRQELATDEQGLQGNYSPRAQYCKKSI